VAVLSALLILVAATLFLQTASDVLSLVRRLLGQRRPGTLPGAAPQRLLFLVPAHNEELLIAACVQSLLRLRYPHPRFSVVVIADNCDDKTVEIARAAGAHCLERQDPRLPGKPRAIAWALDRLAVGAYDAVVIVDADTIVDAEFAAQLNAAGPLRSKAAQGFFDLSNPSESPITRMAAVLATATHRFAYPLKQRAGLNVPLVGNGMALGSDVLAQHGWHAFSICEDWEMYALLTARGVPIVGVPDARVYAQEARSLRESSTQRERWTAGRLTVLARRGPQLLLSRHIAFPQKLDAIAELIAPGPALHLGLVALFGVLSLILHPPAAGLLVAGLGATLVRPTAYTIAALVVHPEPTRAVSAFAFLPIYTLWRVATAARALRMVGDRPWIRTQRHQHNGA
jgi:cellulose synthase/poly-beta-1,6-N-acetylglucosamine synthase-like glycosyltransferase